MVSVGRYFKMQGDGDGVRDFRWQKYLTKIIRTLKE